MNPTPSLIAEWASAAAPPPSYRVSEWADAYRFLPETSAARGSRWQTHTTPYLRGIMDAVHEPGVRRIVLKKCHQSGGSEAMHNILGYFIEHQPSPMLLVHPTSQVAEAWSKERLADMIRSTPSLERVVRDKRQPRAGHLAESTLSLKMFPGGYLALGGANTPNTFARWSVRVVFGDDVDRFPPVVGEEGDPADLLMNRTTSFADALGVFVSTPTVRHGRIDTMFERSDQRRYVVPCPACGRLDWIAWQDPDHFRVIYEERDPRTARLACPDGDRGGCGARLTEVDRRRMIAAGDWRPTVEPLEPGAVGFHVPAMISTIGVTLAGLVEKWLAARERGKESLRVFINTSLAEAWEDRGARADPQALVSRREAYGIEVPADAVFLTAGVDVQVDRFQVQVIAWGAADEAWVVDWRAVPGDPKRTETREALYQAIGRRYEHAAGLAIGIHAVCIDSGYLTDEVYDFVLRHQQRRIYATKGYAGKSGEPIVGKPSEKRSAGRPVRLYPINVDDAKGRIMGMLSVLEAGPGALHFPLEVDTVDEEYFAQLCAEHRETRYNKVGVATHQVWIQDRDRNEALDTAVLCLAAIRIERPNLRQWRERMAEAARSPREPGSGNQPLPTSAAPSPSRPTGGSRSSRSRYLGR